MVQTCDEIMFSMVYKAYAFSVRTAKAEPDCQGKTDATFPIKYSLSYMMRNFKEVKPLSKKAITVLKKICHLTPVVIRP